MKDKKDKKVKVKNKNKNKKKDKNTEIKQMTTEQRTKMIIISIAVLIILAILVIFLVFAANVRNNNANKINNPENVEQNNENIEFVTPNDAENVTEKDIIDVYNFSKEDAKKMVMSDFNSDNFEFYVSISTEGKYIVTVRNTISEKIYKYEVDPARRTFVEI